MIPGTRVQAIPYPTALDAGEICMIILKSSNLLNHVFGVACFALASTVWAQDVESRTTSGDAGVSDSSFEEIVVTARKREESLQQYAGALTAITSDQLETAEVVNLQDIRDLVPNLFLEEALGGQTTPKIFVRGIGIDNPNESFDSPVGIYVDGVYQARAFGALSDLYDIERVEFLRGPQGTLYGRNNSAGALRIITKQPSFDGVKAGASIGFGTESQINTSAYLNVPLKENVAAARFAFGTRNNDGFMTERNSGKKYKKDDLLSGRASLLYIPSDLWEITLRGDFLRDRGAGTLGASLVPNFNTDDDLYTAELNNAPTMAVDVWGSSVQFDRTMGEATFTSITAYRAVEVDNAQGDADGTTLPLLEALVQKLDEHQFTQEAYVTSSMAPGGIDIDMTVGLFYMHEVNESIQMFNVFPAVFGPATTQFIDLETDAFAVFAEASFAVTDRLALTAGLRYTDESKDVAFESFDNDGSFGFDISEGVSIDETTWKAGLDFAVNDDFFLYASAGTGFRSGGIGINPAARSVANVFNDIFGPESATSYEGGFRSTLFNGSVRFNATYFYVEYESLQLAVAGVGGITVNTPDATVDGIEIEFSANLFEGFNLDLNLGTQNDDIEQSDLELKNTPDWQGRLGLTYKTAIANDRGDLTLAADVSYTDDYFVSTANSIAVDGYPLVGAMVRWNAPDGHWVVSVAGKNLTDEYYPIHGFRIIPNLLDTALPNRPRTVMFTVRYDY